MNPKLKDRIRKTVESFLPSDREGILLGIRVTLAVETSWDLIGLPSTGEPTPDDLRRAASLVAGMIEAVRGDEEARKVRGQLLS